MNATSTGDCLPLPTDGATAEIPSFSSHARRPGRLGLANLYYDFAALAAVAKAAARRGVLARILPRRSGVGRALTSGAEQRRYRRLCAAGDVPRHGVGGAFAVPRQQ